MLNIALVGNPNSGKTSLFNHLSHEKGHVGNYPGVTIDLKETYKDDFHFIDLPGIYSLYPYSEDEKITTSFLKEKPLDLVLNIIDGTSFQRGFYLSLELMELNLPLFIIIHMEDLLNSREKEDIEYILKANHLPYLFVSSKTKVGINQIEKSIKNYQYKKCQLPYFTTTFLTLSKEDRCKKRYTYIDSFPFEKKKIKTDLDAIFLHPFFAYPLFIGILVLIFYLTFGSLGPWLQDLLTKGLELLSSSIENSLIDIGIKESLIQLFIQGIFKGITSVFSFLPLVMLLFFFLSLLEDSGYLARMTYLMDKPLSYFSLNGRAFMPLLLGFGCSVPAIYATRNLLNQKSREKVIPLVFFISCSAKIVVFSSIVPLYFSPSWLMIFFLYLLSALFGLIILKFKKKDEEEFFLMEMPSYKLPILKNTYYLMKDKCKDFLKKVFIFVFLSSFLLYLFDHIKINEELSLLESVSKLFHFLFIPLGFTDWRISYALINGFFAKETIISSLDILIGLENIKGVLSPLSAFSFLLFVLLYTPCLSTCIVTYQEMGLKRKAFYLLIRQFLLAYLVSLIVYQGGLWLISFF